MRGLSLIAASGGHSSSRCAGLSLSRPLLLRSTGSRRAGSVIVAHGPSCSAACGIFPDQGSNPRPLHWQADSQPLRHQGSPVFNFLQYNLVVFLFVFSDWDERKHFTNWKNPDSKDFIMGLPWRSSGYTLCFHCRGHRFDPWSGD